MAYRLGISLLLSLTVCFGAACSDEPGGPGNNPGFRSTSAYGAQTDDPSECVPSFADIVADPAGTAEYCAGFAERLCARAYGDCGEVLSTEAFTDEDDCVAKVSPDCAGDSTEMVVNPENSQICLHVMENDTCEIFAEDPGQACNQAMTPPAPTSAGCSPAQEGVNVGEITADTPKTFFGLPTQTFCLCLKAGDLITAIVSDSDTPPGLDDTLLTIVEPDGAIPIINDDIGSESLYSAVFEFLIIKNGPHMLAVSPFSADTTGNFWLTVDVLEGQ